MAARMVWVWQPLFGFDTGFGTSDRVALWYSSLFHVLLLALPPYRTASLSHALLLALPPLRTPAATTSLSHVLLLLFLLPRPPFPIARAPVPPVSRILGWAPLRRDQSVMHTAVLPADALSWVVCNTS